jgi:pyruvate/2-oxoglutarate dehydrogenase complex dihydrolipoamide acyltransferase (E2) component
MEHHAPLTAERLLAISQANVARSETDSVFADVTDLLGDVLLFREQVAELTHQATVMYTALAAIVAAAENDEKLRGFVDGALRDAGILVDSESAFDAPTKPAPAPTKRTTAKKAPAKKAPAKKAAARPSAKPAASQIVRKLAEEE